MTEAELRDFLREMIIRYEKQTALMREDLRLQREEIRLHFAEQRQNADEQRRKTDEIIAEGRAGREALFRIFDRLDNGGAAPAG